MLNDVFVLPLLLCNPPSINSSVHIKKCALYTPHTCLREYILKPETMPQRRQRLVLKRTGLPLPLVPQRPERLVLPGASCAAGERECDQSSPATRAPSPLRTPPPTARPTSRPIFTRICSITVTPLP
ncbi:hypothetical protein OE88DRAFT_1666937 [Heliocybe sulcata]|uniref:Uncharacterized protein n=1 Tax=Heliocybe sulcata TaxID=5364 RepID=A0A5C3MQV4_9AGAM|nr:hypothetical protein OE88DRAFT_1666937 [Heliocybe sulcata]